MSRASSHTPPTTFATQRIPTPTLGTTAVPSSHIPTMLRPNLSTVPCSIVVRPTF
ncbi:hypothetical protein BC567DRAFT_226615 [Phyllosticta citribraziliensis]